MALEIIGAGFGRTGTLSLKHALEQLGFGPCHHMEEVLGDPEQVRLWHRYATTGAADWDEVLAGFRSGVDFPVSCVWRELAKQWPDAKVIVTVRDPDRWWESTNATIYPARKAFAGWVHRLVPRLSRFFEMQERLIWQGLFDGRFSDREHAIAVFRDRIDDAIRTVPANQLLVYEVSEGWEPLCSFLGVPVPETPFPRVNDTARIQRLVRIAWLGTRVAPIAVGLITGLVGFRFARRQLVERFDAAVPDVPK